MGRRVTKTIEKKRDDAPLCLSDLLRIKVKPIIASRARGEHPGSIIEVETSMS